MGNAGHTQNDNFSGHLCPKCLAEKWRAVLLAIINEIANILDDNWQIVSCEVFYADITRILNHPNKRAKCSGNKSYELLLSFVKYFMLI